MYEKNEIYVMASLLDISLKEFNSSAVQKGNLYCTVSRINDDHE